MTETVVSAVRQFNISMKRFHNDPTSAALRDLYRTATGKDMKLKKTVNLTLDHIKDHRKDLKKFAWNLMVTAEGVLTVHYRITNRNTNDSPTYIVTWDSTQKPAGRSDFLYVANSKLFSDANGQKQWQVYHHLVGNVEGVQHLLRVDTVPTCRMGSNSLWKKRTRSTHGSWLNPPFRLPMIFAQYGSGTHKRRDTIRRSGVA